MSAKEYTFLFTDVEGSTRLWEQSPEHMSAALEAHNEILERSITSNNGIVFKTLGDGFCASFTSASDALQAALTAQRDLSASIPDHQQTSLQLKVRMGLYTGPAEERDGDYYGPTLNRVARLMSAGSGEQILISASTKQRLDDALPADVEFRDLGPHSLRDLSQPEHIYQVLAPNLPRNFTPIKSLSPRPTNLPSQLTSFVGRDEEVDEICRRMRQPGVRLLTLVGPGGIGKTRLSIEVGSILGDEYEDGVFFVALAPVSQPDAVPGAIARALKIEEQPDVSLLESIQQALQHRQMLLILDNFEQVIDAAPLVNELLTAAPRLKVLATSREELLIYGEQLYPVSPLHVPETSPILDFDRVMQTPAVRLFVERVKAAQPDFKIDRETAHHIAAICQRLDGLPLALELASVRVRELPLHEIAAQLNSRLQVLNKGPRDLPARQRTMYGAIEWSYNMLPEEEKQTFRQLGIFVGPFTVEATAAIADIAYLNRIKEKSLVHQLQESDRLLTFQMMETLREYALQRLDEAGETDALRRRHADYYLQLTEEAEPHLTSTDQVEWFHRLEVEQYNLEAALEWFFEHEAYEQAARMAAVLWRFWGAHSLLSAGSQWMQRIISHAAKLPDYIHARVAQGAGRLLLLQYHYEEAAAYLQKSLTFYQACDDRDGQAAVHMGLGEIAFQQSQHLQAEKHLQNSLALYQELGDQGGLARCLDQLGIIAVHEGNLTAAEDLFRQSLGLIREHGSAESNAIVMNDLAEVLRSQAKYDEAAEMYRESLELYRALDFDIGVAAMLHNLGQVTTSTGDYQEAHRSFQEALRLLHNLEEKQIIAECLAGLGGLLAKTDQVNHAVLLLSAAQALLNDLETRLSHADQLAYEAGISRAKAHMSDEGWAELWAQGQNLSLTQALEVALNTHLSSATDGQSPSELKQ